MKTMSAQGVLWHLLCGPCSCNTIFFSQLSRVSTYVPPVLVMQGGGKRKGAFAICLEPWHADIFEWLIVRKNHGKEEARARDLFYGLWINDLFMQRVESNQDWSLFCPNEAPGLAEVWGEEFDRLYTQ